MTLQEALKLKTDFGFSEVHYDDTVPCHYFEKRFGNIVLILENDEEKPDVWFGTIINHAVKFYTHGSFESLILAIQMGSWI